MNKLILLVLSIILFGCTKDKINDIENSEGNNNGQGGNNNIEKVDFTGEYIGVNIDNLIIGYERFIFTPKTVTVYWKGRSNMSFSDYTYDEKTITLGYYSFMMGFPASPVKVNYKIVNDTIILYDDGYEYHKVE